MLASAASIEGIRQVVLSKGCQRVTLREVTCDAIIFLVSSLRQQGVLELASLWPETHMGESAGEGAERAEPATTGNRQKGCKDLESDVG